MNENFEQNKTNDADWFLLEVIVIAQELLYYYILEIYSYI